jgi:hypothetical protein
MIWPHDAPELNGSACACCRPRTEQIRHFVLREPGALIASQAEEFFGLFPLSPALLVRAARRGS